MRVAARRRALAEPADGDARLLADAEGERDPDRDREHRGQVADHRDRAEAHVAEVDVPVLPLGRPVGSAHVLREDSPRLHPSHDLGAQVAVQRRADVVGRHRGRDADGGALVAAPGVERAGDLALPVEDVAALLDPARDQHVAVDLEEVLAVEARLSHLRQRADGLGFARDRHRGGTLRAAAVTCAVHGQGRRTGCARSAGRCSATGSPSASAAASRSATSRSRRPSCRRTARSAAARCARRCPALRRAVLVGVRGRVRGVRRGAAAERAVRRADQKKAPRQLVRDPELQTDERDA